MHIGLFLDRDGTVNEEVEFLSSPSGIRLIPGAARAIREANSLGIKVIIVTNQSGVARGYFTEQDVALVNAELVRQLAAEGASVDAIYYCPHHPDGVPPYNIDCECRKPNTKMLRDAAREFDIDLSRSFVVGDRLSDLQAGNNSGAQSILVLTGYGEVQRKAIQEAELSPQTVKIAYIAGNLGEAWDYIKTTVAAT